MRNIIMLVVLCIQPIQIIAKTITQSDVTVSANWLQGASTLTLTQAGTQVRPGTRSLYIQLTNMTDVSIRVPTREMQLSWIETEKAVLITMLWGFPQLAGGGKVIIPESLLAIAEIHKGETIFIAVDIPDSWPLFRKPLHLKTEVTADICNRYKLDGLLLSTPIID